MLFSSTSKILPSESSQILNINESENIDENLKKESKVIIDSIDGKKLQEKAKYVFSSTSTALFSLPECRTLVKVIICGIKSTVLGIATLEVNLLINFK